MSRNVSVFCRLMSRLQIKRGTVNPHYRKIAILGTVGVPACYGGFETLAENLVRSNNALGKPYHITVYCSSKEYQDLEPEFMGARLKYISLPANGKESILYDFWSLVSTLCSDVDIILLLGVSGTIALPLVRLLSRKKIVTNIDGIEWRRQKWQGFAKKFLKFSERLAIRYSHEIITDNKAIQDYVKAEYQADSHVIAYGGDHAVATDMASVEEYGLPTDFSFSVCRIEPENNVHMILEAFAQNPSKPLVFVGNWNYSAYGKNLRSKYSDCEHLRLLDPIYDSGKLASLRSAARFYLHGHSAGGTNPSLVEAMHFGRPILAFDCDFNRYTTGEKARYFKTAEQILLLMESMTAEESGSIGKAMREIAAKEYTWKVIAKKYFDLLASCQ